MVRNQIGFKTSSTGENPKIEEPEIAVAVPKPLADLRKKISELAKFMASTAFSKMRKAERLNTIYEFAELNSVEQGYSEAAGA